MPQKKKKTTKTYSQRINKKSSGSYSWCNSQNINIQTILELK